MVIIVFSLKDKIMNKLKNRTSYAWYWTANQYAHGCLTQEGSELLLLAMNLAAAMKAS